MAVQHPPSLALFMQSYHRAGTRPAGAPAETATLTTTLPVSVQVTQAEKPSTFGSVVWGLIAIAAAGACAYHGAKRHGGSWGWGAWWGFMGGLFPVVTPAVAVAQGFGKPLPRGE